jgi:hypothetical protein
MAHLHLVLRLRISGDTPPLPHMPSWHAVKQLLVRGFSPKFLQNDFCSSITDFLSQHPTAHLGYCMCVAIFPAVIAARVSAADTTNKANI